MSPTDPHGVSSSKSQSLATPPLESFGRGDRISDARRDAQWVQSEELPRQLGSAARCDGKTLGADTYAIILQVEMSNRLCTFYLFAPDFTTISDDL